MGSRLADKSRALRTSLLAAFVVAACGQASQSPSALPIPSAPEPPQGWVAVGGVGGAGGAAAANTISVSLRPGQAALDADCNGSGTLIVVVGGRPGAGGPEAANAGVFSCSLDGPSPQRLVLSIVGGQTTVSGYVIEGDGTVTHAVWFVSVEQPA